jgi:hypothetical protein
VRHLADGRPAKLPAWPLAHTRRGRVARGQGARRQVFTEGGIRFFALKLLATIASNEYFPK